MSAYADREGPDLQRMVTELVSDHVHREPYIVRGSGPGVPGFIAHHRTKVPSLIDQLLEPAPGGKGELSGTEAQARPAVRVEAHDTIELIAREAGEWLTSLGEAVPTSTAVPPPQQRRSPLATLRGSRAKRTLVVLRTLHAGLSGDDHCDRIHGARIVVELKGGPSPEDLEPSGFDSKDSHLGEEPVRREWCCTAHHIEHDVRHWWRQARIIAGWDSPTYRPFATCPVCSDRRSLRINLSTHSAVCVECRTVWGPDTIGLLGEHVRVEREGVQEDVDEGAETVGVE